MDESTTLSKPISYNPDIRTDIENDIIFVQQRLDSVQPWNCITHLIC
jgi:hypothetical protein